MAESPKIGQEVTLADGRKGVVVELCARVEVYGSFGAKIYYPLALLASTLPPPRLETSHCGHQSPGDWNDEDNLPATCSRPKGHEGGHGGGQRASSLSWKSSTEW